MIEARKKSVWKNRYDITAEGRPLATWTGATWTSGGTVELDGRRYQVRSNLWGNTYQMVDERGVQVASADRVGRKDWTVEADGQTYRFRRASPWRSEEELLDSGRRVGSVRRQSSWRSDVVAELPGLPLVVQSFVLAVVLSSWDAAAAGA